MTSLAARAIAPFRPLPAPADAMALRTMQRDRLHSSTIWLVGGVVAAHLAGLTLPLGGATAAGWLGFGMTTLIALTMLIAGYGQLGLLARAEPHRTATAVGIGLAAAFGTLLAPAAGFLSILFGMTHLIVPGAVAALGIVLLSFDPGMRAAAPRPRLGVSVGMGTAVLALGAGVVDALVLLPLTLAPGMSLPQIYDALGAAGEDHGQWVPLLWAAVWLAAISILALGLLRNRRSQRGSLGTLLAAIVLALLSLPVTQFAMGMSIADTMMTGGGMSAAFPAIPVAGALLAALASGLLIGAARR